MNSRRSFFKRTLGIAAALSVSTAASSAIAEDVADALLTLRKFSPTDAASQEDLWLRIAQSFTVSPNTLDLNNAGVSSQPKIVQDAMDKYYHAANEQPSNYIWNVANKSRPAVKESLAALAGAEASEIAINRNTTEALATVTWGLTLQPRDEVVMTTLDYPNMIHAWKQKEMREKIKIHWIALQCPIENEDEIVKLFVDATTSLTKVWHITHMINWTGQILPVKRLCEEARKRNIISIVDGAQSFGHLDFKIHDMDPDYFGTSLHKWLSAPFGLGMLYVKKANIAGLWPLFPNDNPTSKDIGKFESLGTRPFTAEQALAHAIEFHQIIGSQRKEERLRYLKNYWCEKLLRHPRARLHVSLKPQFSCGVGLFTIDGLDADELRRRLGVEFHIITTNVKIEKTVGVRVSPQVYTLTKDLDRFVDAVFTICG